MSLPVVHTVPLVPSSTATAMTSLPSNVHVSTHPCVQAKLSQLRSASASPREVKALIHEISTIVGVEALATGLTTTSAGTVSSSSSFPFEQ